MKNTTMNIAKIGAMMLLAGSAVAQPPIQPERTQPERSQPTQTQPQRSPGSVQPGDNNQLQELISRMSSARFSLSDTIEIAEKHSKGKAIDARLSTNWQPGEGSMDARREGRLGQDRNTDRDNQRDPNRQGVQPGQQSDNRQGSQPGQQNDNRQANQPGQQTDSRQGTQPGQRDAQRQGQSGSFYAIVTCLVEGSGAREIVVDMSDNTVISMKNVTSLRQCSDYTGRQNELDSFNPVMMLRASDLMNVSVKNAEGEDLGDISDLAIDPRGHRVVYGVLARGGMLGFGESLHTISINDLVGPQDGQILVNLSQDQLRDEEGFDSNNWPTSANENLRTDQPTGNDRTSTPTQIVKASDIIGSEVTCSDNTDFGEIDDIIVDSRTGRVVYFIVDTDRGQLPFPVSSVTLQGEDYISRLNCSELQAMPTIAAGTNPNWNDSAWNRTVHERFGVRLDESITARDNPTR